MNKIIGVDFGVPRRAGDQAKKIILIEAVKRSGRRYAIEPTERNERLVRLVAGNGWRGRRRGWTMDELRDSLCGDIDVAAAAFDLPFSLPSRTSARSRFCPSRGGKASIQDACCMASVGGGQDAVDI